MQCTEVILTWLKDLTSHFIRSWSREPSFLKEFSRQAPDSHPYPHAGGTYEQIRDQKLNEPTISPKIYTN